MSEQPKQWESEDLIPTLENWEELFDHKYGYWNVRFVDGVKMFSAAHEEKKQFIRDLLALKK